MENNSERKVVTEVRSLSLEEIELNLTMIPEKEQKVLELRYGLNGEGKKTQKEVGELLGISQSSIIRIERKAINHIKMIENNIYDNATKDNLKELGNLKEEDNSRCNKEAV